jgi:hypothetical protein
VTSETIIQNGRMKTVMFTVRVKVINFMHNKNIMVGILLAEKALLKFPYVKR